MRQSQGNQPEGSKRKAKMKAIGEIIQLALLIFAMLFFGWAYLKTTPASVNGDGESVEWRCE